MTIETKTALVWGTVMLCCVVLLAMLACSCKTLPVPSPFEPYIPEPVVTNTPPVPEPTPEPAVTNTSAILGVGLPNQRLTLVVACWPYAPQSAHFSVKGERENPDTHTVDWFDVPCSWELTDVNGTKVWAFTSRGATFSDSFIGRPARLVGTDYGGNNCKWEFEIHP